MHGDNHTVATFPEPKLARVLFADTRVSWVWLLLRLYVGYEWLLAGFDKVVSPLWVGAQAGTAIRGFLQSVAMKSVGTNPAVLPWYASFIADAALPHSVFFSYLIAFGELFVGIALILGAFTGIAAFFGAFMNVNYLFAGAIGVNPLLLLAELLMILAWRNAGWIGIDRWLLPWLGVPWQPGKIAERAT